jgi:hypothetical protein
VLAQEDHRINSGLLHCFSQFFEHLHKFDSLWLGYHTLTVMVPKPQLTGGDELDDDFVPDDIVALSGGESDAEEIEAALSGTEEATTEPVPQISPTNETIEKKRKRREKEKEKKAKVCVVSQFVLHVGHGTQHTYRESRSRKP